MYIFYVNEKRLILLKLSGAVEKKHYLSNSTLDLTHV